jgi:EAL domain-containing protein (putative c-di-GMP-specific phosphodiesterase class I)/ABC-type amino acid transport substrate-binding protein/GGDEF domain-containing protein
MDRTVIFRMKRIAVLALCVILLAALLLPMTAFAKEDGKTVRVGWYESAFHRTDQFGRKSGYGYEYQQRVAIYTGWTYEYVEGSWSELFEMLVAGNIDLLSDVSYTEARAEQILYSAEAMGGEDYHVFIAPDNTEIRPDDFSTMNGKRVGVNKNSIQEQLFIEWAKNHDVTPEIIELTEKTPVLLEMLKNGEIDMLVTLDTYGNSANIIPVCKVGAAQSFFGINKNRPDLKQELDVAMNRLLEDNRDFNQQMTEKFNKASSVNSFLTAEEKEWVSAHGIIRVGYRDGFLPFCDYDEATETLTGALAYYLEFAQTSEKNAELSFETRPYQTTEEALEALTSGEIDCVFPVNLSAYDGEQRGVIITDPFVTTEMYAVVRTDYSAGLSPERQMRVATVDGHLNHETFVKDKFPNWQIKNYSDGTKGFEAVTAGEADCALVSSYRINRVGDQLIQYKLTPLATGQAMDLAFAVNRENDCLYSILNKTNRLIPTAALNATLTNNSYAEQSETLGQFLKEHLAAVIAAIVAILAIIAFFVVRSARAEAKASEGSQLISETERDELTPLYNKNYFVAYTERFVREHPEQRMDAIVMNIERFHTLNSLNGRAYGDELLRAVGDEIAAFVSETPDAFGARTEGDSFDIFCAHREDYTALLERFQDSLDKASSNKEAQLRMGVMPGQDGVSPEEMFNRAWSACSMVRGDYQKHLMVYDEDVRRRDELSQLVQSDISRALAEHEFEVYYQPKYRIQHDPPRLSSAEALVRWNHPELGMITPDGFIPLFERSRQITALDIYVWKEAARQIAEWRDVYGVTLPVSVNLSRVDVFDPKLFATLDGIIEENGLRPGDLLLEVTESAYTEDADQLIQVIRQLREKGYEIEMDDFGSGYSSLNMLSSLPVDVLKMDMAFIQNIERDERDMHLVELILDIAKYLKVPVVAEGVETAGQLKLLRDAGCDIVQGYYFSRPLPSAEFETHILEKTMSE